MSIDKKESLKDQTKIVYIAEDKNVKVKFFPENRSKEILSTPDHLPSRDDKMQDSNVIVLEENSEVIDLEETSNDAEMNSSSSSTTQKSFPVIDKVIQIESY